jgi:hypothetical protein
VTAQEFADLITRVNRSYEDTGLQFVFDPETDWWPLADSVLNSDAPAMRQRGNAIAAGIPGKIVCFLRWGGDPSQPTAMKVPRDRVLLGSGLLPYSHRSAIMGSTRIARRAGM